MGQVWQVGTRGKVQGGSGSALHGSRRLAESVGLAARLRQPPGAGPGAGTPAGGRRPGDPRAPASSRYGPGPRYLQPPPLPGRGRHLPGCAAFRPGPPHLPGRNPRLSLGREAPGGYPEASQSMDPAGRAIDLAMLLGDQGEITPSMRKIFPPRPAAATCWSSTGCTWGWKPWPRTGSVSGS